MTPKSLDSPIFRRPRVKLFPETIKKLPPGNFGTAFASTTMKYFHCQNLDALQTKDGFLMTWSFKKVLNILLQCQFALAALYSDIAIGSNATQQSQFSQIVMPLHAGRKFSYEWSKSDGALHLYFPDTQPAELDALENYDERLVRRILIKDLGARGTEVKIVLKDASVGGLVTVINDPQRVVLDLFDKNAKEARDPTTGLPLQWASINSSANDKNQNVIDVSAAASDTSAADKPQRRLMQAMAPEATSPNELNSIISKIEPGIGKAWSSFPTYMYRMQLASLDVQKVSSEADLTKLQSKALSTGAAMADYAAKLFDLGHEARAIAAYQQVLQREPEIFEKNPMHLWRLAESHLGVGNLTLAEGYYQTLLEKHPDHLVARLGQIRKLDVQALRAVRAGEIERLANLNERVISIPTRGNAEITALVVLRSSWWSDSAVDQKSRTALASCSEDSQATLNKVLPNIENPKTAYLSSAMIAKRMSDSNTNWQNGYASWLGKFFKRYRQEKDPITVELSEATRKRLTSEFRALFESDRTADVLSLYETLPAEMKSIAKDPMVSWQLAECYRSLGQADAALPFYEKVALAPAGTDRFKAHFWIASISAKKAAAAKSQNDRSQQFAAAKNRADKNDAAMNKTWTQLSSDDRSQLMTGLGSELKKITASEMPLRTPAKILLEQYKTVLTGNSPKLEASPGTEKSDWLGNFSPSSSAVRLLDDLGRKFADLGMPKEHREALELMRFIKPTQLEQDKIAAKIWAAEMTKLAEDHRKADEFLEAGQIYTQIGEAPTLDDSRAEVFYKGGLLLFRAGKKEEAIKALERAKGDPNNLFYSNLATERLNQIAH